MKPKLSNFTTPELYIFIKVADLFEKHGRCSMLDFIYYFKNNKNPILKNIGYKFIEDNNDYIVFHLFSKN